MINLKIYEISEENRRYVLDALIGNTNAPLRVELFVLGAEDEVVEATEESEVK